jgi:four helix bundle protein
MENETARVIEPLKGDPLQRMRVYRIACELLPECFADAEQLAARESTKKISSQLYAAVGSIAANLAEGYAHSSGKDRARIFEYALGSARESSSWYQAAKPVLGAELVEKRVEKLDEIRRCYWRLYPASESASFDPVNGDLSLRTPHEYPNPYSVVDQQCR